MDRKKSLLNVGVSLISQVIVFLTALIVKSVLIKQIGNDINGLNSLFVGIISFLSVAELGVGTSIAFCLYKPIVEGDSQKISALYNLLKKLYYLPMGSNTQAIQVFF